MGKLAPYVAGFGLSEDGRSFLGLDVTDPSVSSEGTGNLHTVLDWSGVGQVALPGQ